MKKLVKSALTLVIALVTVLVLVACGPTEETEGDTLVVGSPEINGDFISGFGDSAYDNWVRSLIFGYSTYATTPLGEIVLNETVVDSLETDVDVDGNKTYTFVIHDDLLWSDDTPMTAKDFVFGIMFSASKDWVASGAESTSGEALVGYSAYRAGETTSADVVFEGVKLINDYEFSVTIDAVELPYFYETLYAAFGPMPMHHLAPSSTVLTSDENGTTMTADGYSQMGDIVSPGGYRYAPIVSSGPYKFVNFVNQVVTLVKDDNFKGNYLGLTPTIQNIIIRRVNSAIDVELVINGELDLVTGVIEGEKIEASAASPNTNQTYYSRNGYGLLAMQAHFGPTMNYKVR
ncbi:MAG: hypothetical protein IH571_02635, partial [Acholeplasmataceae bacterium]|nr:hypothetical protein [Acholeplasmataceae bacterium]